MELGMIGLGRMGGNMVRRLTAAGHNVSVYSATAKTRETFAKETITAIPSCALFDHSDFSFTNAVITI